MLRPEGLPLPSPSTSPFLFPSPFLFLFPYSSPSQSLFVRRTGTILVDDDVDDVGRGRRRHSP